MAANHHTRGQIIRGEYAGRNVIVDYSENFHSNAVTVYFTGGSIISIRTTKDNIREGWTQSGHPKTY
jgi:hypothetical protein